MKRMPTMAAFSIAPVHFLCLISLLASLAGCVSAGDEPPTAVALGQHPLYSQYEFSSDDNVIDFGTQPLWVPTSNISETIARDAILRATLANLGFTLRLHPFFKGDDINYFMRSGDLEGGIVGDMPAIRLAAQHDLTVVSIIQKGFAAIVSQEIFLVEELRGKRVAYPLGSNAHYYLLKTLREAGLDQGDVTLAAFDVNAMAAALQTGEVDAFAAWEPTPTLALNVYPEQRVIHRGITFGYLYFDRDFASNHPQAMRAIVAAQIRAMRWLRQTTGNLTLSSQWAIQVGAALAGAPLELDVDNYNVLARQDLIGAGGDPLIPQAQLAQDGDLRNEFDLLQSLGQIPAAASWESVRDSFDLALVLEIIAQPGEYRLNEFDYDE